MHNLALSYANSGRLDEALTLREEVLRLRRKVNGPEHPDTIKALSALASSYGDAGRLDDAVKLREEVLPLCRRVLGPEHPDTLQALGNLSVSYAVTGRRNDALKLQQEMLPLFRKAEGPEHPDTLRAMKLLAYSYADAGRREEALKMREEVLSLCRKTLGPGHSETLLAASLVAQSYFASHRQDEAIALAADAVELHPENSGSYLDLALWQAWAGRDAAYEATRRQMIGRFGAAHQPEDAERTAKVYCVRPSADTNLLAEALELAERSVSLGKTSGNAPWFELALGLAEYRNGRFLAAEQNLMAAEQASGEAVDFRVTRGTARVFRAMSLSRQHRAPEAQSLLLEAQAEMPPLPKDESEPLAGSAPPNCDLLLFWLACKEAKAMIGDAGSPR